MQKAVVVFALALSVAGCIYFDRWDDVSRSWVNAPVAKYIEVNGPPQQVQKLSNGNEEYRWHFEKIDPKCQQYFEVSPEGFIISTRHTGYCVPIG